MKKNGEAKLDEFYCCVSGNTEFFEFMGSKITNTIKRRIHKDDLERFDSLFENAEGKRSDVCRILNCDDEYRWVVLSVSDIKDESTSNAKYFIEISDVCLFNDRLTEYENTVFDYRTMLAVQYGKYFYYTPSDRIFKMYFIMNSEEFYFYNGIIDDVKNEIIKEHISESDALKMEEFFSVVESGKRIISDEFETTILSKGTQKEICLFTGEPVYNYKGEFTKFIGVIKSFDINTKEDINYYKLERNRDTLTGLLNKAALTEYAVKLIKEKVDRPITIAIMDIDDFKDVNDFGGHSFGDEVLVSFARILKEAVGQRGVAGRFGGDEFFIILDGIGDTSQIRSVLRSIKSNFKEKYDYINKIKISCSIGASIYPFHSNNYDELFKMADFALYSAKQNGKDRFVVYNENLHGKLPERVGNIIEMGASIKNIDYISVFNEVADMVLLGGKKRIYSAIGYIGRKMNIGRINILFGEKFDILYTWGEPNSAKTPFSFMFEKGYNESFDKNNLLVVDAKERFEEKLPLYNDYIIENRVLFCVNVIIGSKDDIKGYISFEYLNDRRKLKEGEIIAIAMTSKLIGNMLIK